MLVMASVEQIANERFEKFKKKTKPMTQGAVIADVNPVQVSRWKPWNTLLVEVDETMKGIMLEEGIFAHERLNYYNFGRALLRILRTKPPSVWPTFRQGLKDMYVRGYHLKPHVLERIADFIEEKVRQIRGEGVGGA